MPTRHDKARREFRTMVKWITFVSVLTVIAALAYLRWVGSWSMHAVIATILGVFFSMLLGCGLFSLAFFSDKSGHDENVSDARSKDEP